MKGNVISNSLFSFLFIFCLILTSPILKVNAKEFPDSFYSRISNIEEPDIEIRLVEQQLNDSNIKVNITRITFGITGERLNTGFSRSFEFPSSCDHFFTRSGEFFQVDNYYLSNLYACHDTPAKVRIPRGIVEYSHDIEFNFYNQSLAKIPDGNFTFQLEGAVPPQNQFKAYLSIKNNQTTVEYDDTPTFWSKYNYVDPDNLVIPLYVIIIPVLLACLIFIGMYLTNKKNPKDPIRKTDT